MAAVATDRLGVRVGEFNVRVEFVVGGLVASAAVLTRGRAALGGWGLVDVCLGGWVILNLASALLFSPQPLRSLKLVVVLAGLLTIYVAVRLLVRSPSALAWAASALVVAGGVVVLLGVACALLFHVIGPNAGVQLELFHRDGVLVVLPKVQSLLWEPNIYGSFSFVVCALAAALALAPRPVPRRGIWDLHRPLVAVGMCGIALSMTRTMWVIGPPIVLLMAALAWRRGLAGPRRIAGAIVAPALLGGLAGLAVGLALPAPQWTMENPWSLTAAEIDDLVRQRLFAALTQPQSPGSAPSDSGTATQSRTSSSRDVAVPTPPRAGESMARIPAAEAQTGSAAADRIFELLQGRVPSIAGRWHIYTAAVEGWLRRPVLGWGAGAFPLVYPSMPAHMTWIANITLHVLFDTGVVGLLLLASAVGGAGWRAVSTLRGPPSRWTASSYVTLGLLAVGAGFLAAFQVTDGTWLGFAWVLLGLLVAAGRPEPGSAAP